MRSDSAGPTWTGAPVRVLCAQGGATEPDPLVRALTASDSRIEPRVAVGQDAVERALAETDFEAVVCEHAPPELDAVRTLSAVRAEDDSVPVVVHAPETDAAPDLFRAGTTDFIPTGDGIDYDLLATRLHDAVEDSRSLDRYRQILQQASEGISVHDPETGALLEANDRLREMLGFDPDADLSLADIVASGGDFTVEAARERIRAAQSEPAVFEWRNRTSDGDAQWVEVSLKPAVVGTESVVLSFVRDTTERHEFERRYEQTRDRLGRVVDRIDDGFFAVDADWRFTFCNAEAERLLGRSAEALLGRNVWEAFPGAVDSQFQREYEHAMETQKPVTFEAAFDPLDLDVEVDAYPAPDGLSVFFRDVSERRRREDVLSGLLDVARDLMLAETEADVADRVTAAATKVLGQEFNAVRYYDADRDALVVASLSTAAEDVVDPPALAPGENHVGRVFERGEADVFDDLEVVSEREYDPIRSAMVLPLSEYGTLSIGATERAAFDDLDLSVANLLATVASAAIERVNRRQELRHYEAVVRSVEGMVCVVADGQFSLVTEPLASFLGYERSALVGRPVADVLAESARETWERRVDALVADSDEDEPASETGTETEAFESTVVRADGHELPVKCDVSRLRGGGRDGVVAVVRDIGELVETRQQVTAERRRFTHLFEHLPDPVVEVRLDDHQVTSVNDAFVDAFGYGDTAVVGDPLESFVRPSDGRERFPALGEAPHVVEVERETTAGERTFLLQALSYERDGVAYAFGVYTDITDQRERERYLQVLNRLVRHNLRNALTVVLGNAAEIRERTDDETVRTLAGHILDRGETLDELSEEVRVIEDVLGSNHEDRTRIDIAPRLTEIVDHYRDETADVTLDAPDHLPVAAVPALERAIQQLVENAVEHGGSARVHVSAGPVDAECVEIRVADDGPGIPAAEWETVVGDSDITQLSHGTGLGLWLVRWIVDACGGSIRLADDGDWTTEVVVTVPHWQAAETSPTSSG